MKLAYWGGPLDGDEFDTVLEAQRSTVIFPSDPGEIIPIQIGMQGGKYKADHSVTPPRLVWHAE